MSSIRDVAKHAGVSPATVSRTFTAPGLLTEETHRRVLEAARQLGYRPRRTAAPTRPLSTSLPVGIAVERSIGFQFFAFDADDTLATNSFYAGMLGGAQSEAASLGMHLLLHSTDRHSLGQETPRMIAEQAISGMLLVGTADPAVLKKFVEFVPQIVLLDNHDASGGHESVVSDGFGGMYQATRFLVDQGHRRLAYFLPDGNAITFHDRLRGFVCAQFEAGISANPAWVVRGSGRPFGADTAPVSRLLALLRLPASERPTALVCGNDESAINLLRILQSEGLHVPDDLSLVGFDDVPLSSHLDPPLTTVRVNTEFMGRLAVRRLCASIAGRRAGEPTVRHEVPVSLVVRQSSRPVGAGTP